MRRAKWTITLALLLVLAMSAAGFAQVVPLGKPPAALGPLDPLKIPQFTNSLPLLGIDTGIPVVLGTENTLSICEFQTSILPPKTPLIAPTAGVPGATWVWGYAIGGACPQNDNGNGPVVQPRSYLGPVVVADRDTPTSMTFINKLPNVGDSQVKAYTTSTDTTLIWGDPLSLNTVPPPINLFDNSEFTDGTWPLGHWPWHQSEDNLCYEEAQNGVLAPGTPCGFNYGTTYADMNVPPTNRTIVPYSAPIPAAVHIHGGEVPAGLDGGPDAWFTPASSTANGAIYGHGFYSKFGETDALAGKAVYVYPNKQEAAPIWFHDHMLGATRLNVYAGIAGGYMITDSTSPLVNDGKLAAGLLPLGLDRDGDGLDLVTDPNNTTKIIGFSDEVLVPLIIQDRMFTNDGQLYFPNKGINNEHPYWVPEFVGDVILVNGKAWPNLNVEAKRYRFLVLNGSNARAYELFLLDRATNQKGPSMYVIANDQGYLDTPQMIDPNAAKNNKLVLMPGERYEIIIDFAGMSGKMLELRNTARTPYPGGAPVNNRTTGRVMQFTVGAPVDTDATFNPATPPPTPANPNPVPPQVRTDPMVRLVDVNLAAVPPTSAPAPGVTIHKVRRLTLNEVMGAGGPLEVLVNNTLYDGKMPKKLETAGVPPRPVDYTEIPTMWNTTNYSELPFEGQTELWEIINITADAHPMHPHLVGFQILNRQPFDLAKYTVAYDTAFGQANGLALDGWGPPFNYYNSGSAAQECTTEPPERDDARYVATYDPVTQSVTAPCVLGGNPDPAMFWRGTPVAPAPQEIGWKDTVVAPSGWVTRILVRFAPADEPVCEPDEGNPALCLDNSDSIGYPFDPNHGHGYVWHCHIVDHEDNEMMRPFTVQPNSIERSVTQGTGPGEY